MADTNKQIVEKVNESFLKGDTEGFLEFCADDVKWTMVGEKETNGKAEIREWMKQMEGHEPPKFDVKTLIGEDDTAVCIGDMTMKEQDGSTGKYGFCDLYRFSGGKITELTSFVVKTNAAGNETSSAAA